MPDKKASDKSVTATDSFASLPDVICPMVITGP